MGWGRRWGRRTVWPSSRNLVTAITLLRGCHLGERTKDVPDGLSDLLGRVSLCVSSTGRRGVDVGLNVGGRTTNFFRSAPELITMSSPVVTVSDVLHDTPQGGGELRVLREHGTDHAEEYCNVASKSGSGLNGRRVEFCEGRVWGIVSGRGIGRWNFLDIDGSVGGERRTVTRNFVDVNRRLHWGVVGEDGIGGRGGIWLETLAFPHGRCGGPRICGGRVPGHARADTRVSTYRRKLEIVTGSGTDLTTVEGIESRNPLPIILHSIMVKRDGPKRVVGRSVAESVSDRRGVWERLLFEATDDAEVNDREASKQRIRIASVVIFEFFLGTESNFITVGVGIGHSNVLGGDAVQGLEFRRHFEPRWKLSEGDATGYTVFAELELGGRRHGCG